MKMNELTKEELEFLYELLAGMVESSSIKAEEQPDIVYSAKNTLAFMVGEYEIDSCNHYWIDNPVEYKAEWNPILNPPPETIIKCKHCRKIYI